jgi:pimeloyl-ACP methyl ester carboxylesterase
VELEAMHISSRNAQLNVESFGQPGNPALVQVMGATASMIWWPDDLCRGLADAGLHVIRYDNRDTGQSSHCPPGAPDYALEDLADDILSVMDGLGRPQAHVMGMSLGGYVAQMAALRAPGRLQSLILLGCEPLGWVGPPLPGIADTFMRHFEGFAGLDWSEPDAVIAFRLEISRLCAGSAYPFDANAIAAMLTRDHARAASPASAFNHGMLASREVWTDAISRMALPVLVLHGTEDPILPIENGRALAASVPGARIVEFPGLGHEIPAPLVAPLIDEVVSFLTNLPPS